jgi:hypothetical protein
VIEKPFPIHNAMHKLLKLLLCFIGLVLLAPRLPAAEKPLPPKTDDGPGGQVIWREDFASPDSLTRFGMAEKYQKPDRLRVEDGALRGQSHKEDGHPTILTRDIAVKDVRMTALVKIPANSYATLIFMGDNPLAEWAVLVRAYIKPDGLALFEDRHVAKPGSAEAGALAKRGESNRQRVLLAEREVKITPDVWHEVVLEARGNQITLTVDGIHTISAAASAGGAEKRSLMLGVGMGDATWFDDVSVTSITGPE